MSGTPAAAVEAPPAGALVRVLGDGDAPPVALVGGKAAGVDRLARLGFVTPPGFCVTAAAACAYREAAGLTQRYAELRRRLPGDDGAAEALAELAWAAPLPSPLRAAIEEPLAALPSGVRLAVRSSATDEDGARASFAGAHESVLGVPRTFAAVEDALRTCWASLWAPAALAYRRRRGLGVDAEMAVIVQRLVEAEAAAVAFTRDPVTGSTREVLVAAGERLGETIMAGGDDAVTFRVDRASRELVDVDGAAGPWPVSLGDLQRLIEIVLAVERAHGCAVDVEAAFDGERWALVQARAVTT